MGVPVCTRLVAQGYEVVAADRRPAAEPAVRATGAAWASSEEVARTADVLLSLLPGTDELRELTDLVGALLSPGATWIDMTSAAPHMAQERWEAQAEGGVECLDAPVGGGVEAAGRGSLELFVGGPTEAVERFDRLLGTLGHVNHVGPRGAGYTTKLLVNLLWFGQALATGEALVLARRAGLPLGPLREALERSAAASEFIRRDLDALLAGDYLDSFGLDRCCDQLRAVTALADELEAPFELSRTVARGYERALARYGPVDGELLGVAWLEEQADVRLRAES